MKHIGGNIKQLRLKRSWNQGTVAERLNISIPAFSKIETGFTDINLTRLWQLAEVFEVTVMEILTKPEDLIAKVDAIELSECRRMLAEKEREVSDLQKKLIQLFDELRSSCR